MLTSLPKQPDIQRWRELPLMEQMANISSEVGRTLKWKLKGKDDLAEGAFIRALDLMDATIAVGREGSEFRPCLLRELCRARELFCDEFLSDEPSALVLSDKYFSQFALAWAQKPL